ncbi:MAG: long-chain-fatty-acid--CoA ligase [Alphaproteobacteria bacterium]|nr:long-chain-fatty-acid--CoA ligase [Alphaproteobacteria bacterium]
MRGLIMDRPLLISSLLRHVSAVSGDRAFVARTVEGPIHRYTYDDAHRRTRQLANALAALGVRQGDRVGTLAWNTHRHFEAYFAIAGMGAVSHTINPRLHSSQIVYIMNHAEDVVLFADTTFAPLVEQVAGELPKLRHIVYMTDRAHMPATARANALCYEELVDSHSDDFDWPEFDENSSSSLCYTSGTTGNPKGALYSHRSTIIHAYASALPDVLHIAESEVILPVVPMFHVNAWGIPYGATLTGAKLVMPGPKLDGASVHELLASEAVTMSAGVPTVWLGLINHWRESGARAPSLKRLIIGGSAAPRSMIEAFQEEFGIEVRHAWGMTEMSPLGSVSIPKPRIRAEGKEAAYRAQMKQGRAVFGVEMRIVDDAGKELPHDGKAFGELQVRGPWITSGYFRQDRSDSHHPDGWFSTGDVCTIDGDGYIQITDRAKDVIKSGGEWISTIELENLATAHPDILQAAVIGVAHPKWDERPLLIAVPKKGATPKREDVLAFFDGKIARWWMPDDVVFVSELPLGATGKILKTRLREQFAGHRLPTA